jgi:hypothetical protein
LGSLCEVLAGVVCKDNVYNLSDLSYDKAILIFMIIALLKIITFVSEEVIKDYILAFNCTVKDGFTVSDFIRKVYLDNVEMNME